MLKIALINPPQFTRYPQPPLGLAIIAAVLQKAGYSVTVLDANALRLSPEDTATEVVGADIVGITAMTPTINAALNVATFLKKADPNVRIIMGGAHVTLLPEETLSMSPCIDIIVRGEGDDTIVELLQAIDNERPFIDIGGISYREDGRIIHNQDRAKTVDMEKLPLPAYHLLPWKKYRPHPPHGRSMPFAAFVTSRGCPYHCAYCSKPVFGTGFRAQSPTRVIDEIAYLKDRFGVKEIAFYDDSFTLEKKRVLGITDKIISSGMKISWTCETRVNLVDKELLLNMRRAGCYAIAYGIESASPEIIETLRKGTTLEQVEKAVSETREAGIQVIGYFMLGSPGETPDTIKKTIDFACNLQVDFAQFSITTPFPGTELYDIYTKGKTESVPWESFVYAGTDNPATPVFESEYLSRDDLKKCIRQAYRQFYLRPSYIWQRLKRMTSWGALKLNINGFIMLLRSTRGN